MSTRTTAEIFFADKTEDIICGCDKLNFVESKVFLPSDMPRLSIGYRSTGEDELYSIMSAAFDAQSEHLHSLTP